jgi:hypothetical protein
MADVIPFPEPSARRVTGERDSAAGEVVIFPGVRVVYHDNPATVDLSRRIGAQVNGTTQN